MAFWTYMLRCSDGRFYTGHTEDLEVRLAQHQQGWFRSCWTYKRRPVELVWCEGFPSRYEALEEERRVGGWSKANKEALVRGDWQRVSHFAKPPGARNTLLNQVASIVVEKCSSEQADTRFSTSLETNGVDETARPPFVSSAVEKHASEPGSNP